MDEIDVDGVLTLSVDRGHIPRVIRLGVMAGDHAVEIAMPYIKEEQGIRPTKEGEAPTGQLVIRVEDDGGFSLSISNTPDDILNLPGRPACSLQIRQGKGGTEVYTTDGIYCWTKMSELGRPPR